MTGQEPIYGFQAGEHIPFRFKSRRRQDLHFLETKSWIYPSWCPALLPKIPVAASHGPTGSPLTGPARNPENPPPMSKDQLVTDSVDPAAKLWGQMPRRTNLVSVLGAIHKMKTVETVNVKQLASSRAQCGAAALLQGDHRGVCGQ